jgi:hypothetical protein
MATKLLTSVPGVTDLLTFFTSFLSEDDGDLFAKLIDLLLAIHPECEYQMPAPGFASDTQLKGTKVDKMAFDRAMQTAFDRGANDTIRRVQQIRQAEIDVKPFVGEIMGMDSAGAVFKAALTQLGHATSDLPLSAMGSFFHAVKHQGPKRVAMDASTSTDLEKLLGPGVFALKRR